MWNIVKAASCLLLGGVLAACQGNQPEEDQALAVPRAEEAEPSIFHQQKDLQAGDSLQIRLLSWGGEAVGNYLLLFADSAQERYYGNSFFRKGKVQNAWVDDLDGDRLPEVGVVLQEQAGDKYGRVILHELSMPFHLSTITLPQLSETIAATYGGHDSIYLQNGQLIQEFRIRNLADTLSSRQARQRVIYILENNALSVLEAEEI